jgi:hypothetical protein
VWVVMLRAGVCYARGRVCVMLGTGVCCAREGGVFIPWRVMSYARGRVCVSYVRGGNRRTVIQKDRPSLLCTWFTWSG